MKAKLVNIDLMLRVIVPDNATDEMIDEAVYSKFLNSVHDKSWVIEGITEVKDDTVIPFDAKTDIELIPIRQIGSGREGTIHISFEELKGVIGEPNVTDLDDPDKVKASWGFKDRSGRTAYVWSYKYDSPYDCLDWSTAGSHELLRDLFGDLFTTL